MTKTVRLGRLEDGEAKPVPVVAKRGEVERPPGEVAVQTALGLSLSGLTSEARRKYTINDSVPAGSRAHQRGRPGLAGRRQAASARRGVDGDQPGAGETAVRGGGQDQVAYLVPGKDSGKATALLLVANAQGEVRFVAVPVK